MTLAAVAIIGLAAYRLARLIAHDKIGEPIRRRAYGTIARWPRFGTWLNALVTCPFCLSVYAAVGGTLWYAYLVAEPGLGWAEVLLTIPAAAGVAALAAAVDLALSMYVDKHPL